MSSPPRAPMTCPSEPTGQTRPSASGDMPLPLAGNIPGGRGALLDRTEFFRLVIVLFLVRALVWRVSDLGFSASIVVVKPLSLIWCLALVIDHGPATPIRNPRARIWPSAAISGLPGIVMLRVSPARLLLSSSAFAARLASSLVAQVWRSFLIGEPSPSHAFSVCPVSSPRPIGLDRFEIAPRGQCRLPGELAALEYGRGRHGLYS